MYKYTLFMAVLFTQLSAQLQYGIGDQIEGDNLAYTFDYCYPDDSTSYSFSFSKHSGKVFMIEMSTSW